MDNLRIYIITWNVATGFPDDNFDDLLDVNRLGKKDALPDFYVIGLQEVKSQPQNLVMDTLFNDPWTNIFKTTLAPYDYVKVKTARLVGLLLNVFCLRKHVIHLRDMNAEQTKTGLMGFWGNKGAVTIRLQIYGCSVCLVNSHLAPHDNAVKERVEDYNAILQGQKFNVKDTTTILFHDYVYWFGDLNFRLIEDSSLSSSEILKKIEMKQTEFLMKQDQLKQVMRNGEAFSELIEGEVNFPPSYKYFIGSQDYDLKRRPAWTDRILYRVNKFAYENITLDTKQLSYKSYDKYGLSDHKPVVSEFLMKVFSNYTERQVEIKIIGNWKCDTENKAIIILEADVIPSLWDWIGLYPENFTALDDYLYYVYLTSNENRNTVSPTSSTSDGIMTPLSPLSTVSLESTDLLNKYIVTFPDTAVRCAGQFRLLYFTRNSNSVLGMSDSFTVEDNGISKVPLDW
ncbi:hypothetical protein PGB90_000419 [Kerria lacca]